MIHSSRQARPTSTLRRTASATPATPSKPSFNLDAAEFTRQFNFQHLLKSPLPSPALPSIVPRHGKKPAPRNFRRAFRISIRLLTWLCGVTFLYWLIQFTRYTTDSSASVTHMSVNLNQYNYGDQKSTAGQLTPVVVADTRKKPKWTVSIPQSAGFPLRPSQYADICAQSESIIQQLDPSAVHNHLHMSPSQSRRTAAGFIDVQEAHDQGLLPTAAVRSNFENGDTRQNQLVEENQDGTKSRQNDAICEKSLTFTMESADAGMGKTLLGLWMAYGLAREEGRAFFIDDSNWAYGRYDTFFRPPPLPPCRLPPATQRLPCPHRTRHLVVSTSTYQWVFGDLIGTRSHEHHSHKELTRKRHAISLARAGHDALFHLSDADADYLSTRLEELDSVHSKGGLTIGLHVRRGDRHPWEAQYLDSYIPPSIYSNTAQSILIDHFNPSNTTVLPQEVSSQLSASKILIASDDPEIYSTPEFTSMNIERAQSHILLASKANLDAALPDSVNPLSSHDPREPAFTKFVEPNVGWEGGFFASIFWGLGNAAEGRAAARGLREERPETKPSEETLKLREYVGRAYLLDLKVLGAAKGGVICGVSSFGCRVLGVVRGWKDVKGDGSGEAGWRNVDRGWDGWVGFVDGE
ncbi:MAG: hypothetical protein Q9203_005654 [Teloschistes exilis]